MALSRIQLYQANPVPVSGTSPGIVGQAAYDSSYLYIATSSNQWNRISYSSWPTDPYINSVTTLLHFNGVDASTTFNDSSLNPKTFTGYGNARLSTAQSRFGNTSLYLDGSNSYISASTSSGFGMGTGDFTLEGWFYPTTTITTFAGMVNLGTYINGVMLRVAGSATGGDFLFFLNTQIMNSYRLSASNLPANSWTHVALVRNSGTVYVFVGGSLLAQQSSVTYDIGSTQPCMIGKDAHISSGTNSEVWTGYIDEVRITKGVGRYTSSFTPPTDPFPNQ
jgi:hypothetical protein